MNSNILKTLKSVAFYSFGHTFIFFWSKTYNFWWTLQIKPMINFKRSINSSRWFDLLQIILL